MMIMFAAIVLGAAYYVGSTLQERRDAAIAKTQSSMNAVAEIQRALERTRRFESSVLSHGSEAGAAAHEAALADAISEVDGILDVTSDPILKARAAELRGEIVTYGTQFGELVEALDAIGRDDNSGLRAALRESGDTAERRLSSLGATALASLLKTLRQQDRNSLVQHGATSDGERAQRKAAFEQALATSSLPASAQVEIVDDMTTVFRHAAILREANLALNVARDRLTALSRDIDSAIDGLASSIEAQQASLRRDIEPSLVNPPKDVLAIIVIGMTLSALVMWTLGQWLLPPVIEAATQSQGRNSSSMEGHTVASHDAWAASEELARLKSRDKESAPQVAMPPRPASGPAYWYEDIEEDVDTDVLELSEIAAPAARDTIAVASPGEDVHQLIARARKAAADVITRISAVQDASDDAIKAIQTFSEAVQEIDKIDEVSEHDTKRTGKRHAVA